MNLESVLARLEGVRRSGTGWMACCPAHEDRSPSLSVIEREGKILLHCHAGCPVNAICAALGIEVGDLFTADRPTERIEAVYPYLDEGGKLLYEVLRYSPKNFKQRRPDGRGGWVWNLDGVRRVPYRLPEVLAATDVLIPEGEKDCETARKMGFVATCNSGGAGKWNDGFAEFLRGKHVTVISDADEAGRKHARQGRSIGLWQSCISQSPRISWRKRPDRVD